jgi:hypothetical protein
VHIISQPDLDVLPFAGDPYIRFAKFTKKIQRGASLLAKGQLKRIVPASLPEGFLHVIGHAIETVGRTEPFYALVGTLVVVISDPVIQPL